MVLCSESSEYYVETISNFSTWMYTSYLSLVFIFKWQLWNCDHYFYYLSKFLWWSLKCYHLNIWTISYNCLQTNYYQIGIVHWKHIIVYKLLVFCLVGWVSLVSSTEEWDSSLKVCPGYNTKLCLLVRLSFWSSGKCGVLFHCHYSQVHIVCQINLLVNYLYKIGIIDII